MKKILLTIVLAVSLFGDIGRDFIDGVNYNSMQNYEGSNNKLKKVLEKLDKKRNHKELARVYYLMGNNFFYLEKYNLAIENFNEAIKYADHKEARPQFKSSLYAFLGFAYEKATMMDSAIVALEKSEKLYDALKDKEKNKKHIAKVYLSFGDIYSYKQDYATANIYYKKAYAIYIDLPKVSGEFLSSLAQRINAIDNRQH